MDKRKYRRVTEKIAEELRGISGQKYVIFNDEDKLEPYSHDEIPGKNHRSMPELLIRPETAGEISEIIKLANREMIPVTPRGAGSGLSGGAVPVHGGIVLQTDRMNRILELDEDNLMITVEPGIVSNEINEFLKGYGLFYAGYPMSLETCFIGGNVAENAGGGKAVKYGVTSRYVLGLEIVTAAGDIIQLGGKLVKDVTGYSILQLMLGSEGTLAVFTKITLKLLPRPRFQADLLCLFNTSAEAINAVPRIMKEGGIIPASIEFMDQLSFQGACDYLNETLPYETAEAMLLITVDGSEKEQVEKEYESIGELCEKAGATEVYVADNPTTSERIWKIRRNIAEAYNLYSSRQSGEDIVVPPAQIPEMIEEFGRLSTKYGILIPCFGHAGDGNLHARLVSDPGWSDEYWNTLLPEILEELYAFTKVLGGTLSGEHGIGSKRKKYMKHVVSEEYISLMRSIKTAFDPKGILNPGKIFD